MYECWVEASQFGVHLPAWMFDVSRCPSPAFLQRTFWLEPAEILPHSSPDAPSFIESFYRPLEPLMPGSACAITV